MTHPLFLNIDATDILLIFIYLILHLVSLILFIVFLVKKRAALKKITMVTLLIQCVFDLIVVVSFFNPFSLICLVSGVAFLFIVFRSKIISS